MFFFFKQKTAYEMRISDWSSDVCSSDLVGRHAFRAHFLIGHRIEEFRDEQPPRLAGVLRDRGQRRMIVARELDVVIADDRDVARHAAAGMEQRSDRAQRDTVRRDWTGRR